MALSDHQCRGREVEEISRLEHELSKATTSLKSSLEAVSAYESRVIRAEAELKLKNARCTEAMARRRPRGRRPSKRPTCCMEVHLPRVTFAELADLQASVMKTK
ncbi:hypothetical protein VNO80_19233 [Phaseolus coccineus]|uniref:Uncharacterized protein n=1 Tax=Phaseolus coccineus TaxID=3886 RepID=A0AAN9R028_PHACN